MTGDVLQTASFVKRWEKVLRAGAVSFLLLAAGPLAADVQILREIPTTYVYPMDGHIPFNIHRGTPTLLSLMLPGASFNNPQGVACALLKSTENPKDPLDDVEITVLGLNSGAGEIFYNVGLRTLKKLGTVGKGINQFQDPMGVALHPSGEAAVADTGNNRVVILHHDGYRLAWVRTFGGRGMKEGEFNAPQGVAFDSLGNLYVTDTGNNRVQVRDPKGLWHLLPIEGLEGPTGIAVTDHADPWTFYTNGVYADRMAVIDRKGTRLSSFSLDGKPLSSVTAEQAGDLPFALKSCAFDYLGHVVAADQTKGALRKFDRDLKPLAVYGEFGDGDFHFRAPRGVCISKQLGQIVISEESSVQYMWIGADALTLRAENGGGAVTFHFYLTEPAYLTADVRGAGDVRAARIAENIQMDERDRELVWTPAPGTAPGAYRLELSIMATYSSRERLAKVENLPFTYVKTVASIKTTSAVLTGRKAKASLASKLAPEIPQTPNAVSSSVSQRTLGDALREARSSNAFSVETTPSEHAAAVTPTSMRSLGEALEAVRATQTPGTPEPSPTPTNLMP